ncbi:AUGMIN subunit 1 isoform X1 [Selaginella moellendorffii]|uniref:AUGMIN subunit 1 isoform X1 n=1 Tax=Selaginella moellendorffii TaxID=88036 RepID=UPI000D1C62BE|nr:AUGMIN subunit 1 isoform X1 [Selaginella moellendorffii]XP_024529720.1 AUGMIN subunit 1 isoform X1 [Selaginella moellendorffii]XP_024529721.1 AUGMIN subunit 1 isoform X1 [Selaginella moellendorffii]|eukprot:XP_024529719.1 AUGMIN subunit 1 isoform X1 [Selaginella moellendorffii]
MAESGDGVGGGGAATPFDAAHVAEVKAWITSTFEAVNREVPAFEYTPRTVAHLHGLATLSQNRTQVVGIVAADLRQKAAEFRAEGASARVREILDCAGLAQENFSQSGVAAAQTLATAAHLLDLKDTETGSFLIAMADLSLKKTDIEEKRAAVKKESKMLLDNTRKAISRLTYLKRTLGQLEEEVAARDGLMGQWETNLKVMASKERQYLQQLANYKAILSRVGYTPEISHGVLMQMVEHRKDLERKTKPILDTLRSYQDLPPDKALAELAIEDKRREYEAAEKHLEEALQSALNTTND